MIAYLRCMLWCAIWNKRRLQIMHPSDLPSHCNQHWLNLETCLDRLLSHVWQLPCHQCRFNCFAIFSQKWLKKVRALLLKFCQCERFQKVVRTVQVGHCLALLNKVSKLIIVSFIRCHSVIIGTNIDQWSIWHYFYLNRDSSIDEQTYFKRVWRSTAIDSWCNLPPLLHPKYK